MKKYLLLLLALFSFVPMAGAAEFVRAIPGRPAPQFDTFDTNGKKVSLGAYKGRVVVLEWTNHECPFVHKQYDSGNMQKLQQEATADGVVWISIVSSANGKEGFVTAQEANNITAKQNAHSSFKILDPSGDIGHLYGAKTTPHMFVIDKDGTLVYAGAIDDKPDTDVKSIEGAHNYVRNALKNLKDGKPVEISQTNPYGCGVKY